MNILLILLASLNPIFAHETHDIDMPEIRQLPRHSQFQLSDVILTTLAKHPQQIVLTDQQEESQALQTLSKSFIAGETALSFRAQTDKITNQKGLQEYEVSYEIPFWWLKQRSALQKVASAAQQQTDIARRALLHWVAGEVRELLWKIAQQESVTTLTEHEWDVAIVLEKQLQRRLELGETSKRDLLLVQEETLRKQAEFQQAEQELYVLFYQYQQLTGLEQLPFSFEETLQIGRSASHNLVEHHPVLETLQRKIQRSEAELEQTRQLSSSPPSLSVGVRREQAESLEKPQHSVGLALRVPLGHDGQQRLKIATAQRQLSEIKAEFEQNWRDIHTAIKSAEYTYHSAQNNLKTIELQRKIATDNLRLAKLSLQHGEMGLIDFQKIQALAFAADRAVHQKHLALKLAVARYHQALGILPEGLTHD
jgi:outer membrane protein, heavy metal efflux system